MPICFDSAGCQIRDRPQRMSSRVMETTPKTKMAFINSRSNPSRSFFDPFPRLEDAVGDGLFEGSSLSFQLDRLSDRNLHQENEHPIKDIAREESTSIPPRGVQKTSCIWIRTTGICPAAVWSPLARW